MNENTKRIIRDKITAIYTLTDEALERVNKEGKVKLAYPFSIDRYRLEDAIFEYIESHIGK